MTNDIQPATVADLAFIDELRAREWYSVGFIPITRYQAEVDGRRHGSLLVIRENDELAGFIYATYGRQLASIAQIAICDDARRIELGRQLVAEIEREAAARGRFGIKCRVALDLAANAFWRALGFRQEATVLGKFLKKDSGPKSRELALYERLWTPRLWDGGNGEA